jgi:cell division protein FtsI (penicillin-binding protein 3)
MTASTPSSPGALRKLVETSPPEFRSQLPAVWSPESISAGTSEEKKRDAVEKSRGRLVLSAGGFVVLFGAVITKLTMATVISPDIPKPAAPIQAIVERNESPFGRSQIVDRNGEVLAVSLPVQALFARPGEIENAAQVADKLIRSLPDFGFERDRLIARLTPRRTQDGERQVQFVYLARGLTPRQQQAVNDLGIAGIYFESAERRVYPQGRMAVHVVGQVDVDGRGIAGIERQMDQRLRSDNSPLRLSIDSRLQISLRDAVNQAITDFSGIGGAGIVMDVQTAEVLAMVSLPDYDGNDPQSARHCDPELNRRTNICERFNRATAGVFEPGSTFKLMTAAMALETGTVNIWNGFDASRPIRVGRFTIEDYRGKHRWLAFPEILAYSSNIGTAHMASAVGPTRHRDFMNSMGMLRRIPIELPETVTPLAPSANSWRDINTMTIGFGHGIAVTPLHVITGVSALVNGGILRNPSIVAAAGQPRDGVRVVSERTSEIMRRVMRLVVTDGSGRGADVPGYFVGGKTGTAQKTDTHGRYMENKRIAAFVGAFPMNDPKYAIYVMVDEPSPNARSHGYATAGWVAAPAAGQVIGRIAPILGLAPEPAERIAEIQQRISIPMQPTRPANTAPTRPSSASGGVLTAPRAESRDRR